MARNTPSPARSPGTTASPPAATAAGPASRDAGAPLSPAEVLGRLGGGLAYTTVVTILARLHAKGMLSRHKDGRSFRYAPADDPAGLAARRLARMLDAEPDREGVLARFMSGLSGTDEDLLRRVLGDDAPRRG